MARLRWPGPPGHGCGVAVDGGVAVGCGPAVGKAPAGRVVEGEEASDPEVGAIRAVDIAPGGEPGPWVDCAPSSISVTQGCGQSNQISTPSTTRPTTARSRARRDRRCPLDLSLLVCSPAAVRGGSARSWRSGSLPAGGVDPGIDASNILCLQKFL